MPIHQPQNTKRSNHIDVVRGFALFGILLVNVWSLNGNQASTIYGYFSASTGFADKLAVVSVALLAEAKAYPLFAFLFGAGFAMQTRSVWRQTHDWELARTVFRRRMKWLLVCGVLHGTLIWFGDVLTAYALCGLWMSGLIGVRLRAVVRRLRKAVIWALVLGLLMPSLVLLFYQPSAKEIAEALAETQRIALIYTQGTWLQIARLRLADYGLGVLGLLFFIPQLMLLFVLGVLAVRRGWLTRPERHQAFWRKVQRVGLWLGIPLNVLWALIVWHACSHPNVSAGPLHMLSSISGPPLASAYLATLMLAQPTTMRRLTPRLAPLGRMGLTNYLMQSLLLTWILQGFGLGWGAWMQPYHLFLLCIGIISVQIFISRWWLSRIKQGPVEMLWRWFSYRRVELESAPRVHSEESSTPTPNA
jgi:uncharacterized protein